jgi:hypothetical protein
MIPDLAETQRSLLSALAPWHLLSESTDSSDSDGRLYVSESMSRPGVKGPTGSIAVKGVSESINYAFQKRMGDSDEPEANFEDFVVSS